MSAMTPFYVPNPARDRRLTDRHAVYRRDLHMSTALQTAAAFVVSENVREIRERQQYLSGSYIIPMHPSMHKHLSEVVGSRRN